MPDGSIADVHAVAQHRHPVGDGKDLVEPVADVDDADPAPLQIANDLEQARDLVRGERRGRLVHDQDAGLEGQRLGNLDELLLRRAESPAGNVQIDRGTQSPKQLRRPGAFPLMGHESRTRNLLPEKNILIGGQARDEIEFLVDDRDAGAARVVRAVKSHRATVDLDRARVGAMGAAQHLHQGAFSGAIFPQQRQHLAGSEREVDSAQCPDARE